MATDYFLKFESPELKGESIDEKHKDEIQIDSFSWGATQSGTSTQGTGLGSGKIDFSDFTFNKRVDAASPLLLLNCAKGTHYAKCTLTCRKPGGEREEYYTITFKQVLISSMANSGQSGNEIMESISFNYASIYFEYKPQKEGGGLDTAKRGGWDQKGNKEVTSA